MYARAVSRTVQRQFRVGAVVRRAPRFFSTQRRAFQGQAALSGSPRRQPCFALGTAARGFSTHAEEPFRRFRSYRSGDHFSKRFADGCAEFTLSVAYSPKDRQQTLGNDEGGSFAEGAASDGEAAGSSCGTGEDNYIVAYTDVGVVVGVLDGVGGWSEQGFDSSAISRELAQNVTRVYLSNPRMEPMDVLNEAFRLVKKEGNVHVGSTTVCFGIIDADTKQLKGLNLGDSWFGVFRKSDDKYRCVFQSNEQVYYFNAPYQLSVIPRDFLEDAKRRGSKYLMNEPTDAEKYEYQLKSDDVVVFTTDGLVDNIFPEDIELYLNDQEDVAGTLGKVNKGMVDQTKVLSLNTNFKSVFSQRLSKETGQSYIGGKPDDITSVMVYVK